MSSNISYSSPSPSLHLCASFAIIFIIAELWKNRRTAFFILYVVCLTKNGKNKPSKVRIKMPTFCKGFSLAVPFLLSFFPSFLLSFTKINWFFFFAFFSSIFSTLFNDASVSVRVRVRVLKNRFCCAFCVRVCVCVFCAAFQHFFFVSSLALSDY